MFVMSLFFTGINSLSYTQSPEQVPRAEYQMPLKRSMWHKNK